MPNAQSDVQSQLAAAFARLPKVVQDAILSADVEKHMRELAAQHQLHFDQWTTLENEVMFALLGFQPMDTLAVNIEKEVGVSREVALSLADDVSRVVFAPIRAEMERGLSAPTAQGVTAQQSAASPTPVPIIPPGTPPAPAPEGKAVRAPISEAYVAGHPSHERKTIDGDPYREPIV